MFRQFHERIGITVVLPGDPGGESHQLQADVGMHHLTCVLQLICNTTGQVDGDGEAQTCPRTGTNECVDADHLTVTIHQRPAGITGIDRGIGLNQIQTFVGKAKAVDVAVKAADDAESDRPFKTEGSSQGDGPVADLHAFRIAEGSLRWQIL